MSSASNNTNGRGNAPPDFVSLCHCDAQSDMEIPHKLLCHCEERSDVAIPLKFPCHCEERSDVAISPLKTQKHPMPKHGV